MKKNKKLIYIILLILGILLIGGGTYLYLNKGDSNPPVEEKSDAPIVFVFSGQSNMEGQTNFGSGNGDTSYLTKAGEKSPFSLSIISL